MESTMQSGCHPGAARLHIASLLVVSVSLGPLPKISQHTLALAFMTSRSLNPLQVFFFFFLNEEGGGSFPS